MPEELLIKVGQEYKELPEKLSALGYERVDAVTMPGEFSVRGGLIDIYSLTRLRPIRLDFFGDKLESIHYFSPIDQQLDDSVLKETIAPVMSEGQVDYGKRIRDYQELAAGDYVVHRHSGIGKYIGTETLLINGVHRDYLHLQYAKSDKLYVPIEQIDLVQKYVCNEGTTPKISTLGSGDWERIKRKTSKLVEDMAEELLELYAEREQRVGFAFSPDTPYQREFESDFPYEETADQLRSIAEIKKSMESPKVMDRLLCGDVGYGKTEVAMRAVFKAVMDHKQAVVLVPTTVLAEQHYINFKKRFSNYPINIAVLSRLQPKREQVKTVEHVAKGEIDVLIGTHRVLSKDVIYKDLGLLVIDEEQRFGVKHKEALKQLKKQIDVLTLSATPIPRTLYMAMMELRELSILETPPKNRLPVNTFVSKYSEQAIKEAIERELERGGQIYYVFNHIPSVYNVSGQLAQLVPKAKIAFAHGRMDTNELQRVMIAFMRGEYNLLVSTVIIENGLDISNVNTLIIRDADHLGLAQLYQLRGRVGRSDRSSYAYFTYQPQKELTEVAQKRLQAIRDFTDLGSGFKIAMRDMAIRGVGNLLGSDQHGHVAAVGFNLYTEMLQDAIAKLRNDRLNQNAKIADL